METRNYYWTLIRLGSERDIAWADLGLNWGERGLELAGLEVQRYY